MMRNKAGETAMSEMSKFDALCSAMPDDDDQLATINVADGCYMGMLWFASYGVKYTAADLLKFSQLVMDCKERLKND